MEAIHAFPQYVCRELKTLKIMKTLVNTLILGTVLSLGIFNTTIANTGKEAGDNPVFRLEGQKVYLNLFNEDFSKVTIKVYDAEKRLVYSETNPGELVVRKALSFEKAYKGDYTVLVADGENTYRTKLSIQ